MAGEGEDAEGEGDDGGGEGEDGGGEGEAVELSMPAGMIGALIWRTEML